MIIGFNSKYKSLMQDISYYWEVVNFDIINIDKYDVIITDINRIDENMRKSNAYIIGVTEHIKTSDDTLKLYDLIRIPYDLPYVMFKLNKIQIAISREKLPATR